MTSKKSAFSKGTFTQNSFLCLFCLAFVFIIAFSSLLQAKPIPANQARKACRGWMKTNTRPLGVRMDKQTQPAISYSDEQGQQLYHAINLEPEGFVILSTDDEIEPVIAFSPTDYYDGQEGNPLKTLLEKDMKQRLDNIKQAAPKKSQKKRSRNLRRRKTEKWNQLLLADGESEPPMFGSGSISDIWVPPFMQTQWDQGDVLANPCYNYYTPNNYVTGCVATAMAQVMRYHTWPQTGIGVHSFSIQVDGVSQNWNTRGGDGNGGPYNWAQMPLSPQAGVTTTQRQAIGALNHDAGVAVNMAYRSAAQGGSSASLYDADEELVDTFMYTNSIYSWGFPSSGNDHLWTLINTNLDAQLPVILGISRTGGGHAVVADGYGYDGSTPYHHINMGWGGTDNAWYNLPLIDASYTYTGITDCIYNLYTSGTGEIISGRVTDLAGAGLDGATVTAYLGATPIQTTTTSASGVYAFANLSSNTQYKVSASKSGYIFSDVFSTTGYSYDGTGTTGNKWAVNIAASNATPPTAMNDTVDTVSTSDLLINLPAIDDNEPNLHPPALTYTITSLPSHGDLSEPNVGPITQLPYTLGGNENLVDYTPCPYYGGQDTFTFKANDGGAPPTGGDSNIATITVNVDNQLHSDFGTDSNTYLYGMMMDTDFFYDARSQVIYLASEIGGAKRLTDLSIRIGAIPGRTLSNWTIRMQHTNKTYFQTSAFEFLTSGWTTVYQNDLTITQTGWINFQFDTPFDYNGTQNLMIDFSFNNTGTTSPYGGYFIKDVAANRAYSLGSNTGTHGDPLNWGDWYGKYYSVNNSLPGIKLTGIVPIDPILGDFDRSCTVSLPDLGIFSQAWQTSPGHPNYDDECDIATPTNNQIDLADLTVFVSQWLNTYP